MPWTSVFTYVARRSRARSCVASGELAQVALKAKDVVDAGKQVLIFDDVTSKPSRWISGNAGRRAQGCLAKDTMPEADIPRGPGRPKLGVVAREVTLLPRHWDWLNAQPGGASVALRKLVDEARRTNEGPDRVRQSQEAAYRFMSVMAGNRAGFEEATRALFAGHQERFNQMVEPWPDDIRNHAKKLAGVAFQIPSAQPALFQTATATTSRR